MLFRPTHGVRGGRGGLVSNKEKLAKIWKYVVFGGLGFVLHPLTFSSVISWQRRQGLRLATVSCLSLKPVRLVPSSLLNLFTGMSELTFSLGIAR